MCLLDRLYLDGNPIADISHLGGLAKLRQLSICNCPILDLSVLACLPQLESLDLTADQVEAFGKCLPLDHLRKLVIWNSGFGSIGLLPDMPQLRDLSIQCCEVGSLAGVERYSQLRNLWATGNRFADIGPLAACAELTHIDLGGSPVANLEPLCHLPKLRRLGLHGCQIRDIKVLFQLPMLREVYLKDNPVPAGEVDRLQASLGSWDLEFFAGSPNHEPSLDAEVVSQAEFDYYDTYPFNMEGFDWNRGMIDSEHGWLTSRLEKDMNRRFSYDDDYWIPFPRAVRRSTTVMLMSAFAIEDLVWIVYTIQRRLCQCRYDWIIWLQTDCQDCSLEFTVWVYADKIVTTAKHQDAVRAALSTPRWSRLANRIRRLLRRWRSPSA